MEQIKQRATGGVLDVVVAKSVIAMLGINWPTVIPRVNQKGSVSNSYWDTSTSGLTTSAGGAGVTDSSMKQQSTFSGWDFAQVWEMDSYPKLINIPKP